MYDIEVEYVLICLENISVLFYKVTQNNVLLQILALEFFYFKLFLYTNFKSKI
jgi:hypothetical protein